MEAPRYVPHYTVEDYLGWSGDWELWDGVPVALASPKYDHQALVTSLLLYFENQLRGIDGCHCETLTELDWHISHDNVLRPDISIVCKRPEGSYLHSPPELIVEVLSPSTASKDRIEKRKVYAEQGVRFFIIADPTRDVSRDSPRFEVLRLNDGHYELLTGPGTRKLTLHDGCDVAFDPAAFD